MKLLRYKTKSFLRNNKTPRSNESYQKAASIGVIFTTEDREKHDEIKALIRKMEKDGKKVKALTYLPANQENYDTIFDFFTYLEISFWGNVTATSAQKFAETPFDFLLYLDAKPNDPILNVVARSKAKCRIGKFWEYGEPYFEMMIECYGDTKSLIEHLYKYTAALK